MAPLSAVHLVAQLKARGETLACAESCTGGMIGAAVTAVAGSSAVFLGGVIAYANEVKRDVLGVSQEVLDRHGAVSRECVGAMALGAQRLTGATWAVSVSGVAGPDGGTQAKPVGLVFVGLTGPNGVTTHQYNFDGNREQVRASTVAAALELLERRLVPGSPGQFFAGG